MQLNVILRAGATVTVPVWVRPSTVGSYVLRFLLYYESEVAVLVNFFLLSVLFLQTKCRLVIATLNIG